VAPFDHKYSKPFGPVKSTDPVPQMVVLPVTVITGLAGAGIAVKKKASEASLWQVPSLTFRL